MIKDILIILGLFVVCCSCQDDETSFGAIMPKENLSFRPVAGGAVMHYQLPADDDIFGIRIRYQNGFGEEITCTGSYACDSILLGGFSEARQGVEATVLLCHRNGQESEPVLVSFDTEDSGPVAFFKKVEVKPGWDGFSVSWNLPSNTRGIAHILYIGKSPLTQKSDTILMESVALEPGKKTLSYQLQQAAPTHTVVIRTEDYRGYMVKQQIWKDVPAYEARKLTAEQLEFLDPTGISIEEEQYMLGSAYLFDGDTKGEICWQAPSDIFKTFLAGPEAVGKPFIIDMKEEKLPAMMRVYGMLHVREYKSTNPYWAALTAYMKRLPCKVRCYGSNDKGDETSWQEIGSFSQAPSLDKQFRWAEKVFGMFEFRLNTKEELALAKPAFFTISFPSDGENYRYLKMVVEDIFLGAAGYPSYENTEKYVSFHELEVYVKKD